MRRFFGPVLLGLGGFLVVGALLMRFYAYPTLAVAPVDPDSVTELSAQDVVLFDSNPEVLDTITTDLTIVSRTKGDVAATEEAPEGTRVWVSTTSVRDSDGVVRSRSAELIPMDARTSEARDFGESWQETVEGEKNDVTRSGHVLKFPFNTQKQDHEYWDSTARQAFTAEYAGTEDRDGLETYVFEQEIPDTVVGTREVPGALLGFEDEPSVEAEVHYENSRTLWIEPATGALVDRVDDQRQWLTYDGAELVVQDGTIAFTDEQVATLVADYKSSAPLLAGMRSTYPLVAGLLGLLALLAGVLLMMRTRSRHSAA